MGICFFGAGGRTRTGTLSPAVDFESTTSTNSITPAGVLTVCNSGTLRLLGYPDIFLGEPPASAVDPGHSLNSLLLPQAALASLPITPAGAQLVYTRICKIASIISRNLRVKCVFFTDLLFDRFCVNILISS